ncbi:hypothetical protein C8R45DRAFT_1109248 [Mycena sanguinolenta]|nr:hypothetical protein C8R45DRAFT_1109248 [Mycena sanguinolenta]
MALRAWQQTQGYDAHAVRAAHCKKTLALESAVGREGKENTHINAGLAIHLSLPSTVLLPSFLVSPLLGHRFSTDSHRVTAPSRSSAPHVFAVSSSHVIAGIHPARNQSLRPRRVVSSIEHHIVLIDHGVPYRAPRVAHPRPGSSATQRVADPTGTRVMVLTSEQYEIFKAVSKRFLEEEKDAQIWMEYWALLGAEHEKMQDGKEHCLPCLPSIDGSVLKAPKLTERFAPDQGKSDASTSQPKPNPGKQSSSEWTAKDAEWDPADW